MNIAKSVLVLLCMLFVMGPATAQKKKDKGKRSYNRLEYKDAVKLYEKKDSLTYEELVQIADVYRLNHNTESAAQWYAQVVDMEDCEPINLFYYAQALQSNGNLELAKKYYLLYHEKYGATHEDDRGAIMALAIENWNELKGAEFLIEEAKSLNSDQLDFSPSFYKNGLLFVSTREVDKGPRYQWTDGAYMRLYFAPENEAGFFGEPRLFFEDWASGFHLGPLCFTGDYERVYFTQNDFQKGKRRNNKKGVMKMGVFTSVRDGESWTDPTPLDFNMREFDECHPTISDDGQTLYFASDREGGYGGMDLYVAHFENGKWVKPTNLGPTVNTPGNELFPYVHSSGNLYFSSDSHGGAGGLDIYVVQQEKSKDWGIPENLGFPFNSEKDDFGMILNAAGTEGYFTSTRKGGTGKDDIYHFLNSNVPAKLALEVVIYDEATDMALSDVGVRVLEKRNPVSVSLDRGDLLEQGQYIDRGSFTNRGDRGDVLHRAGRGDLNKQIGRGNYTSQGDRGDNLNRGDRGDVITRGDRGDVLNRGDRGDRGDVITRGDRGDILNRGDRGDRGDIVTRGDRGDILNRGDRGDRGDVVTRGDRGDILNRGDRGDRGDVITRGDRGDILNRGDRGDRGDVVTRGDRGDRGDYLNRSDRGDRGDLVFSGDRGDGKHHAHIDLEYGKEFLLIVAKEGYTTTEEKISTKKLSDLSKFTLRVPLKKRNCTAITGVASNNIYGNVLADIKITLINMCTGEEMMTYSDSEGNFIFDCVDCNCDYALRGDKTNFLPELLNFTTIVNDCSNDRIQPLILKMTPDISLKEKSDTDSEDNTDREEMISLNTSLSDFAGKNADEISVGEIVELEDLFYDFDRYDITDVATAELNILVDILTRYPDMTIELSSHTDCRGRDKYNNWLSGKRAAAAVTYLIEKGIDPNRMVPVGHGELQIRNRCHDGVDCSEKEHQFNRRTEVRVMNK